MLIDDDFAERTLPPTERRRREARQRGEVARSAELTSAVILLSAAGLFWFIIPASTNTLAGLMKSTFNSTPSTSLTIDTTGALALIAGQIFASILAPIMLVLLMSGFVANVSQTGWLWMPGAVLPQFRSRGLLSRDWLAKGSGMILRSVVLACVTSRFLMARHLALRSMGLGEPLAMLVQPARLLGELCIQLSLSLVLLAIVDYGYQFWRQEQRLKMTVEERRREQRDDALDPRIKRRRMAISRPEPMGSLGEIARVESASN